MSDISLVLMSPQKPKTSYTLIGCLLKEFDYWQGWVKEPIKVCISIPRSGSKSKDYTIDIQPAQEIRISPTLFYRYSCMDHPECSQCCMRYWNIWPDALLPESIALALPKEFTQRVCVTIGNKNCVFVCYDHTKYECQFLNQGCTIHQNNPISCMFPLVHNTFKEGVLSLSKRKFGRNHLIGCPVRFQPYDDFSLFEQDTVSRYIRLRDYLNALQISNIVQDVIDIIRAKVKERVI